MNRFLARWTGVILAALSGQAVADIPMVTRPLGLPMARTIPQLPTPGAQEFGGVTMVAVPSVDDKIQPIDVETQSDLSAFGSPCGVSVDLRERRNAMLELRVTAPCKPHAMVHVSHAGLGFHTRVGLTGQAMVRFPAMTSEADVFIAVEEELFEKHLTIDEVHHFARIVLVGHDTQAPNLVASMMSDQMTVYHNNNVQMFSVDLREITDPKAYRMTLRHEVTDENCDRPVQALYRRILPGLTEEAQVLQLAPQGCGRVGRILELKNILPDLKLAAN